MSPDLLSSRNNEESHLQCAKFENLLIILTRIILGKLRIGNARGEEKCLKEYQPCVRTNPDYSGDHEESHQSSPNCKYLFFIPIDVSC